MKPFNLVAARLGDPIQGCDGVPFTFIGITSTGYIMVEDVKGHIFSHLPEYLRMSAKKRTVWVNFYPGEACWYPEQDIAERSAHLSTRLYGKSYAVEVEE